MMQGISNPIIVLVWIVVIILFIVSVVLELPKEQKGHKGQKKEEHEQKACVYAPKPSPQEQTLIDAQRLSFQLNVGAMEAYRQMADAARRHEYEASPSAWYVDADYTEEPR